MTNKTRAELELLADQIEGIARLEEVNKACKEMKDLRIDQETDLYAIAWQIKQIARWRTPSFGI